MAVVIDERFKGQHYVVFRDFLESACGIMLGDNKQYLVSSRLNRILDRHEISNLSELVEHIKVSKIPGLRENIIDAMTTNETLWFRDSHPFVLLSERVIPDLRQGKVLNHPIKVWSAASSSGQEAYSISMIVAEYQRANLGALPQGVQIVGTDVSKQMIEQASKAEYDSLSLSRGLSQQRRESFFEPGSSDDLLRVRKDIRSCVSFKQLNLLDNFSLMGKFDIIFCRNVLIYFSADVKLDILHRLSKCLNPKGYLFIGGTESIGEASKYFDSVRLDQGVFYQLKEDQ